MKPYLRSIFLISLVLLIAFTLNSCGKKGDPDPEQQVAPTPTVEIISPTSGYADDVITLTGSNFSSTLTDNTVKFNGTDATVITATTNTITVKAPLAGSTGTVNVKVKNSAFGSGPVFTYLTPVSITSISPISGSVGDNIIINGTDFSMLPANNGVVFGGNKQAAIVSATTTKLVVKVPADASTANIQVKVGGRTATSPTAFTVVPAITTLTWERSPVTLASSKGTFATAGNITLYATKDNVDKLYRVDGNDLADVTSNLPAPSHKIYCLTSSGSSFYIATFGGVFRSTDGINWTRLIVTMSSSSFITYGIFADQQTVAISSEVGFFTSANGGNSFTQMTTDLPAFSYIGYLTGDKDGNLYGLRFIGYSSVKSDAGDVLNISVDGGKKWIAASTTSGNTFYNSGDMATSDVLTISKNYIFLLSSSTNDRDQLQLKRSMDQGRSWIKVTNAKVNSVKVTDEGATVIYGGASFNVSTNGGDTFTSYPGPPYSSSGEIQNISRVEKIGNYYYIICTPVAGGKSEMYRAKAS